MSVRSGLLVVLTVLTFARSWLAPVTASAAPAATEAVDAGAHVTQVDDKKPRATARATIDKGKRAGIKIGDVGELYPFRASDDSKTASVDFNVRLATGRVVEVKDDSAVIALESVVETVTTGAYFSFKVTAPVAVAESALFRVTALGIRLRAQYADKDFVTLEQMLADPSEGLRNRALDAMIADVKGMRDIVVDALKERIEEGAHHGKTAGQVVDALDRAQLSDFLLFVEAFPGKYIGHRWKLPEVYFTWVINGTPSGERTRKLRLASKTIRAAQDAEAAGKLDEARAHWQTVLRSIPDHKAASEHVARIDRILLLTRTVAADPDDTASSYALADELFNLGAHAMAMKATEPVRKRGYEPFKTERLRGYLFVRLKKYKEAEAIFRRLVKNHPDDKNLDEWLRYTRAHARIARAPKDPAGYFELAAVNITSKSWDAALDNYRKVLDNPRATAAQRATAKAAQERISVQKDIDQRVEWAKDAIVKHDIKHARDRIAQIMTLAGKLNDDKQAGAILDDLAQKARMASEEDLALELFNKRVQQTPTSMEAHAALAYALLGFDRIDEAEAAATKSLQQKGDAAYSNLILSYVARARGDLGAMESFAKKAAANSPKYAWPLITLARAAAARGEWDAALGHAKKAIELAPGESDMRSTHVAVTRGHEAAEALRSASTSPRERLKLVRAYGELGLVKQAAEHIAKLPADGSWRADGWLAVSDTPDTRVLLADKLAAARSANSPWASRKRKLAIFELRTAMRSNPRDDARRIELARLYLKNEEPDAVLATLEPLMHKTPHDARVGDLVHDARQMIVVTEQLSLARDALGRGDHDNAFKLADGARKVFDRLGSYWGPVSARETMSDALAERGRYADAIKAAEEALRLISAEGDPAGPAIVNQRIGRLKANIGTADAQRKALEDARKVFEARDDELSLYYVYIQLAVLEKDEGQGTQALDYARKAWTYAERLGRKDLARTARFELADANLATNRFTDAEQIVKPLLVDSRKADDIHNEQLSLMVLGFVAMMRGQGPQARAHFQEVYNLGTRTGQTSWRALARRFEGTAWLQADRDAAKAAAALEQADALYQTLGDGWATQTRGGVLRELADARLLAGKLGPARQAADQALALAQRYQRAPSLASANWMLALIAIEENKADEAMTRAAAALALAQKTQDDAMQWNAWHAVARAHELKKQDQAAVDAYEKALSFLGRALQATGGETEKQGYMNTGRVRELYSDAIARLLKAGKNARAMEILELSRDAMLKQQFDPTKVATKDAKVRARLETIQEKRDRVKGLQKQLAEAMDKPAQQRSDAQVKALSERIAKTKQELNQVVLDLKVSHRQLFQALAMDPQNLVGRKDYLPPGSVLVEYFVAEDALYAFVIARNLAQPAVVRIKVTSAQLDEAIAQWREAIIAENEKVRQRDKVEELGRKLDDWLLEPLRPHLDGASALILIPFGPLYYVPFDALVVSEAGQPVRYAIEDFRISIQTATTLEHLLKPNRPRGSGTMLAVSNPDGTLPGAKEEVSRIVKTALPDAQVLGQTGRDKATVKKFTELAGNYRYLHLATHGILDPDPRKSHMILADGPLTVEKISQLQGLDTANELVVLSACDTAVEQGKSNGDELVSVAVAFSMAGSPALVASLWEVSDESTVELMAAFYKLLEQSKGDRLDALREAKLALMRLAKPSGARPFAQPWHWSSFQIYGDYRTPGATR